MIAYNLKMEEEEGQSVAAQLAAYRRQKSGAPAAQTEAEDLNERLLVDEVPREPKPADFKINRDSSDSSGVRP